MAKRRTNTEKVAIHAERYAKKMRDLDMPHRAVPYDALAVSLWARDEQEKSGGES